jgi:hypothetical protein
MDKMKIRFDPTDNTLQVWFASPQAMSHLSPIEEDTPGDFHLIKNDQGQVIGLECQLYHIPAGQLQIDFETAPLLPKNGRK